MLPKLSSRPRAACARRIACCCAVPLAAIWTFAAAPARADSGALPIVASAAPRVVSGVPIKTSIAVSAGAAPYTFELIAGALPVGLGLARDGTISGTATQSGQFRFTIRVTDSSSPPASVTQSYLMVVDKRPDPTLDPNTIALVDQQASAARRFALAQIGNFQSRLEALRAASAGRCSGDAKSPSLATPAASHDAAPKSNTLFDQQPPPQDSSFDMPIDNCRTLPDRTTTLWTAGALNVGTTDAQTGAAPIRFASQGLTLGGDYGLLPNLAFGAGVGLARDQSAVVPAGNAASGGYGTSVTGYLSYRPIERVYLEAVVGVGGAVMDSSRPGLTGNEAYGSRRVEQRFVSLSAGRQLNAIGWQLTPYTRVDHVRATLRALNENGSDADALAFSDESVPSLKLVAGAKAETSFTTPIGTLAPRTSFEYRRELERADPASLRYADDPSGTLYSIVPNGLDRDSATVGLGANLSLASRWNFGLGWMINRSTLTNSSRVDATIGRVF